MTPLGKFTDDGVEVNLYPLPVRKLFPQRGSLEVAKSQRDWLAVLVVLNDRLTAALGWFSLFLLFALFHLL